MKYFYDTEFIEREGRAELISIGIVAEEGREYYAENLNCDLESANEWVRANVVPSLWPNLRLNNPEANPLGLALDKCPFKEPEVIAEDIIRFIGDDTPEFWAYCGAFDHVLLVQLFKGFDKMPKHWPYFTHDIAQLAHTLGEPELPNTNECMHHALADARWNRTAYDFLMSLNRKGK